MCDNLLYLCPTAYSFTRHDLFLLGFLMQLSLTKHFSCICFISVVLFLSYSSDVLFLVVSVSLFSVFFMFVVCFNILQGLNIRKLFDVWHLKRGTLQKMTFLSYFLLLVWNCGLQHEHNTTFTSSCFSLYYIYRVSHAHFTKWKHKPSRRFD